MRGSTQGASYSVSTQSRHQSRHSCSGQRRHRSQSELSAGFRRAADHITDQSFPTPRITRQCDRYYYTYSYVRESRVQVSAKKIQGMISRRQRRRPPRPTMLMTKDMIQMVVALLIIRHRSVPQHGCPGLQRDTRQHYAEVVCLPIPHTHIDTHTTHPDSTPLREGTRLTGLSLAAKDNQCCGSGVISV